MINMQQGACVSFGASPLPAYFMKVFALPRLVTSAANRRNTGPLQSILQDVLGITPDQGVVVYVPVPGENMATENTTAANAESSGNIVRTISQRLTPGAYTSKER